MKLLLAALLAVSMNHARAVEWTSHPYDKMAHATLGSMLSCAVTHSTKNPYYGILSALAVGTIKEISDKNFDNADLASWGLGGVIGVVCIKF